jgi:hypothetical protein
MMRRLGIPLIALLLLGGCGATLDGWYKEAVLGMGYMELNCVEQALSCAIVAERAGQEYEIWRGPVVGGPVAHAQTRVRFKKVGWAWARLDGTGTCVWVTEDEGEMVKFDPQEQLTLQEAFYLWACHDEPKRREINELARDFD